MPRKLAKSFYRRKDTLAVARELLGKTIFVRDDEGESASGRIVEVEAYLGIEDKAAHSHGGRKTDRTRVMYRPGGVSYVYLVYGMYHQFNVIVGDEGRPHGVLVRAVEPVTNIEGMRRRRGEMPDTNLTSGPGKLCIALGIDRTYNEEDLEGPRVWIEDAPAVSAEQIASGPRIGIDYAEEYVEKPWRFWLKQSSFASRAPRKA